jgi:hypothetical protein
MLYTNTTSNSQIYLQFIGGIIYLQNTGRNRGTIRYQYDKQFQLNFGCEHDNM